VFLTIYICTINLLLLFDNKTGMTHLKITFVILQAHCCKCDSIVTELISAFVIVLYLHC